MIKKQLQSEYVIYLRRVALSLAHAVLGFASHGEDDLPPIYDLNECIFNTLIDGRNLAANVS